MFSLVEAAKVSVKYDVETSNRKGVVREPRNEVSPLNHLSRIGFPPLKSVERPTVSEVESKSQKVGEPKVTQIFPNVDKSNEATVNEDKVRSGKLFLKRGVATKEKTPQKPNNVRLPVLPKRAKLESIKNGSAKEDAEKESEKVNVADDKTDENSNLQSLPLVSGASSTFQAVLK